MDDLFTIASQARMEHHAWRRSFGSNPTPTEQAILDATLNEAHRLEDAAREAHRIALEAEVAASRSR